MQPRATPEASAGLIEDLLAERFGEACPVDPDLPGLDELARIAGHRVHRRFLPRPVEPALLRLLCACALSAPSKSDLRGKPFPNDHLDLFFNAAVDSAIVLATFMRAAAAVGLGCCPISAIRDHPDVVSDLLALPPRVIPTAGLCVGWPAEEGSVTPRLGLAMTLHEDRYAAGSPAQQIEAYDRRREQRRPYRRQRNPGRWGESPSYGWSEDKARQYAEPLRTGFGVFVRAKGFRLE
jgi:nitroreductase/FMN reductase [NAD(P)H]